MGSDTGGSIRIPAALCGCVGLKPTFGRVSKAGVVCMSWQFDHTGPITRTVRDAAIMLGAIAGYDPADFATVPVPVPDYLAELEAGLAGLRVGVLRGHFSQLVDAEVAASFEGAAGVLKGLGADVRDLDVGMSLDTMMEAWALVNAETQAYHADSIATRLSDFGQDLQAILTSPLPDALGLARAYRASYDVKELFRRTLEEYDVLIAPATRVTATEIGQQTVTVQGAELPVSMAMAGMTMPFNLAGLPALSLPCGFSGSGMPIGMQIAGRPFDEATVLRAGHAYEQATEWHLKRPVLPV
jgi:aspartyl-tRNA(Asn)/glutamyl-tRNA(Gln) amidotransferase subunit A